MQTKKAQSIIEYAAVVGVVISALILMNQYVQRAAQTNIKYLNDQVDVRAVNGSVGHFIEY